MKKKKSNKKSSSISETHGGRGKESGLLLPIRCSNASRYKGLREPRCLGGPGCVSCWAVFKFMMQAYRTPATR